MGKPSKLTPETHDKMVQLLSAGQRYEAACDMCGISYQTHRNWMIRGEAEKERLTRSRNARPRSKEQPYLDYFEAVKKATSQAEVANLGQILRAARGGQEVETQTIEKLDKQGRVIERKVITSRAPPTWQAAAWFLERRMPHEYGRRDTVKVEMEVQQQLERLFSELAGALSPEAYAEVQRFVAERISQDDRNGSLPN